ncbi:DEAD/DEAH box helicase [Streptomyces antibioticus]|uniref:DEAD/DEAH box helicase n=1 Tax=Streptomyces antibioticus TaxID=1890 RepID=UPI0036DACCB9
MDRTVDPEILAVALGEHQPGVLPSPAELAALIADVEVNAIRAKFAVSDELLGTAWYLHGVAAAAVGTELYDPVRRQRAFAVSAHVMDLALNDPRNHPDTAVSQLPTDRPDALPDIAADELSTPPLHPRTIRARRLDLAFAAQIGYRRCDQDPNASAVFRQVSGLLITDDVLASHLDTLAVEAAVAFLSMQRRPLTQVLRAWRRQLRGLQRLAEVDTLRGTMYGPAQDVIEAVHNLTLYLTRAETGALEQAEVHLRAVVTGTAGGDRSARWVAAHLLELLDDLRVGSLNQLLPPGAPPALAQAFTLSDPPVMTLWPPQRELLNNAHALDPSTSRLLISVPTSAGKTLMAQMVICAHLVANTGRGRVLYVSPLRSLGREMRQSLRARLRILGRTLGQDLPEFPGLGALTTTTDADVEVVTPERLMHALRQDANASFEGVGLIVVDEAHHMAHGERGFVLEGLLAFCRALSNPPRLILLSAAVGNHGALAAWLDPDQPPESVVFTRQWRGPRRLHGLLTPHELPGLVRTQRKPRKNQTRNSEAAVPMALRISLRPTAATNPSVMRTPTLGNRVYAERYHGDKTETVSAKSIKNYELFAEGAAILSRAGSVLMVCPSRVATRNTARAVADRLPEHPPAAALGDFLAATLGEGHPIVECVRHGVAYHHAQLPAEVLHAVEDALRADQLKVVCCTSTLTDGVNLPVRSVIINDEVDDGRATTWSGQRQMGPAQLLNAVGRAGRAGRESEGWILLTRHRPPHTSDFDLLEPSEDRLEVLSTLGTAEALAALAEAEALIAQTADAIFQLAEDHAADFVSYVWFTLDALFRIPTLTARPPLAAVNSLLAMRQLPQDLQERWLALAARTAEQYEATDPRTRRRWTTPGTSIGTARELDRLADHLTSLLLQIPSATQDSDGNGWVAIPRPSPLEWTLEPTVDFFAQHHVYDILLRQPEAKGAWSFREKPSKRSPRQDVDVAVAIAGWISGEPIPRLAGSWLPGLDSEWALEQTVSNISDTFEHYLAWTVGALVNLVNLRLEEAQADIRLTATTGWHLRHGVNTPQALALLNAGVTSRRLAHQIGRTAAERGIPVEGLRTWLTGLHFAGWRDQFAATEYETNDLLEYVRRRRPSMIGALLDDGHVSLDVLVTDPTPGQRIPVQLRPAPGSRPAPLVIDDGAHTRALIPADAHLDVHTVIDSGIEFETTLTGSRITFRLPDVR